MKQALKGSRLRATEKFDKNAFKKRCQKLPRNLSTNTGLVVKGGNS